MAAIEVDRNSNDISTLASNHRGKRKSSSSRSKRWKQLGQVDEAVDSVGISARSATNEW